MSAIGFDPDPNASSSSEAALGASAQRKASLRLLPIIGIGYCLAYMDRINISFASLRMNSDLHFSATVYGLGAGLFFIGYALCEVPSNLLLLHFGPKRWLARIMLTWGLLAAAMMFVRTPWQFYGVRFLLGTAEAGFFPGVLYYLTLWFPASMRARAVSRFYIALPLSSVVMGVLAGWLMNLQGTFGLAGWQWLFIAEGLPAALFSFVFLWLLPDGPMQAEWLTPEERMWLKKQLAVDSAHAHLGHEAGVMRALLSPKVWMMGAYLLCALTANYAYGFSAPAILQAATGWSATNVGFLIACFGGRGGDAVERRALRSPRRACAALHCSLCNYGCRLLCSELCDGALAGGGRARREFCFLHGDARPVSGGPDAVSGRTRSGCGPCRREYHHHVQRIHRPLLDGPHARFDRQLRSGTARTRRPKPRRRAGDVPAHPQPGAHQGSCRSASPGRWACVISA
jgi:ACS family tartrate transporter-like MFS transporter